MATSYLSPGVYIEEVDRGSKPIEAVGTSTAAFIGESSVGPTNEAVLITNWAQYTRTFGDFSHSTLLAHAVYGFFNNGGTKAFICNVSSQDGDGGAGRQGSREEGSGVEEGCRRRQAGCGPRSLGSPIRKRGPQPGAVHRQGRGPRTPHGPERLQRHPRDLPD